MSQPLANFFSISLTIGSPSNLILKSVSLLVDHVKVSHDFIPMHGSDLRIFNGPNPRTVTSKSNLAPHQFQSSVPSMKVNSWPQESRPRPRKPTMVFFTTEFSPRKGLCPVLGEVGHSDSAKPLCNCDLKQAPK